MNTDISIEVVHSWLEAKCGRQIDRHEELIQTRLLDSLSFLEMVSVIEKTTQRKVNLKDANISWFSSIEAIAREFFEDAGAHAGVKN